MFILAVMVDGEVLQLRNNSDDLFHEDFFLIVHGFDEDVDRIYGDFDLFAILVTEDVVA